MQSRALLLTLVMVLATCAALAVDARTLRVDGPLVAGHEVTVSWDGLPAGTAEFELLLACDEPVPLTIRLTESMDPELTAYAWRVPRLACGVARLQLRAGIDEREVVWAASAPFRIAAAVEGPERAPDVVREHGGELWMEGEAPVEWHGLPSRFESESGGDMAEPPSVAPLSDRAVGEDVVRARAADGRAHGAVECVASPSNRSPRDLPLRI